MTTLTNQIRLIQEWGFKPVKGGAGLYERNIYNAQGYKEFWEAHKPEVIQFYKGAMHTEDYKISWNLFTKEAA
jgi:hypothetical protein